MLFHRLSLRRVFASTIDNPKGRLRVNIVDDKIIKLVYANSDRFVAILTIYPDNFLICCDFHESRVSYGSSVEESAEMSVIVSTRPQLLNMMVDNNATSTSPSYYAT